MIVDAATDAQTRARLWNLMLGGGEDYEAERLILDRLRATVPSFQVLARNERDFITRFWRFATGIRGIKQVVYLGAPIPAGLPPHRRLAEPGRVVYVEGDELLFRKGSAWMSENGVDVVRANPLDVAAVVDAIESRVDWLEPVAVIAPNVLSWIDQGPAQAWITDVVRELAQDSMVATTHLFDPELPDSLVPIEKVLFYLMSEVGTGFFRRRVDLEGLFSAVALETPGVTPAVDWFPNGPRMYRRELVDELLAVAVVLAGSS